MSTAGLPHESPVTWSAPRPRTISSCSVRSDTSHRTRRATSRVRYATCEAVTFVDNDLLFQAGWLERLIACAEETGAWLVTPIIVQRGKHGLVWHMVGGACNITENEGRRRFREDHNAIGRAVNDTPSMDREQTGFVEFHCVLVAGKAFDACFPLDEDLRSSRDHCDLTLAVRTRGGEIWLEPSVTITQLFMPDRLPAADRRFYALRWSDPWNRRSIERFREKWDLDPDDPLDQHDLVWLSAASAVRQSRLWR